MTYLADNALRILLILGLCYGIRKAVWGMNRGD